jgi:hypothetical protein
MRTLIYVPSTLLLVTCLHAAAYCSLSVKVESPSGKEVATSVVVEDESGWRTERTTRRGPARFCGLGIKPVSVIVGDAGCNQVVVRNVPLRWNETRNLSVTYDDAPCLVDTPPVAACTFLLRFVAANHDPLGAVSFKAQKPFDESHRGDEYGRMFLRIAAGQELFGVSSASGYKPAEISIPCISKNQRLEQIVVLEKSGQ